jgi:hypothetical protein
LKKNISSTRPTVTIREPRSSGQMRADREFTAGRL